VKAAVVDDDATSISNEHAQSDQTVRAAPLSTMQLTACGRAFRTDTREETCVARLP